MAQGDFTDPGEELRHAVRALLAILSLLAAAGVIAILGVSGSLGQAAGGAPAAPVPAASIPVIDGVLPPIDADVRQPTTLPRAPSPEAPCRMLLLADHAYPRDHSCLPCECVRIEAR
jgi:hypothetical protein